MKKTIEIKVRKQNETEQDIAFRYAQNFDYERLADLKNKRIPNNIEEFSDKVYKELYSGFSHASGQGADLGKLKEGGILNPSEKVIQGIYETFAKKGDFWAIEDVYIATNFEPKVSKNSAQKGYKNLVKNHCADTVKSMQFYLGVEPKFSKNFVHKSYSNYLNNLDSEIVDQIASLEEITGMKANYSKDKVMSKYNSLMEKGLKRTANDLIQYLGVK